MTTNRESDITRHGATDPQACEEMRDRYGWKYLGWEPTGGDIFEVNCLFAGEAKFPKSYMDLTQGDQDDD